MLGKSKQDMGSAIGPPYDAADYDICTEKCPVDGSPCVRHSGHQRHHQSATIIWDDSGYQYVEKSKEEVAEVKCTFCGSIPKMFVTAPEDEARICIECALQAIKILVRGAIDIVGKPQPQRPTIVRP